MSKKACSPKPTLPDEVKSSLKILNNSERLMALIVIGTILRYQYISVQRNMLINQTLCPEKFNKNCYPDGFKMQVVSSLLIIFALFGFYGQSLNLANQSCCNCTFTKAQGLDITLSEIIIIISLIRFCQLFNTNIQNNPSSQVIEEDLEDSIVF